VKKDPIKTASASFSTFI